MKRLYVKIIAALVLTMMFASSAEAAAPKYNFYGTATVYVGVSTDGYVSGLVTGTLSINRTVYVKQCNGLGHNCAVIAGTHDFVTSWKPVAAGHVYQTCATFYDLMEVRFVNVCSPFIAVPT